MKKHYETADIRLMYLYEEDVITSSGEGDEPTITPGDNELPTMPLFS